ncbi:MAG: hypothetical protein NT116_06195, partial [Candidatus Parcubacteria bacterium]|nr:hypothetical protein [Candidatus Parcubacteria bacterium]
PDSESYPIWAKYWAFRSMVGLSGYDKEKHAFGKRKKDTVAPFPDLNREALAYVVDIIVKKANKEKIEAEEGNPELWELIKGENFGKLYAYAIEKVTSTEKSELLITAGQWVKFDQGSDHMPLVDSLQGHGTGWCTAGESTAKVQLQTGDFYVYYTNDKNGQPKIPRIAIRMDSGSIAEVRGIAPDQNLDPYIGDVVKEKLKEFPDGKEYEKKSEDMKRLTDIEKKQQLNEDLSIEEIKFLYELEVQIQGFGYNADPRIEEIKKQRDQKKDYALIFDCHPDEVTLLREDPTEKTKVLKVDILNTQLFNIRKSLPNLYAIIGSLAVRGDNKELPAGLTYISRDLNLENSQLEKCLLEELPASLTRVDGTILLQGCPLKKLPEALAHIGGHLDLRESRIEDLPDSLTYIGKNIFIGHCPLKKLPEALAYIGGGLYLEDSQVKKLPAGLTHIGRDLIINNPEFQELPDCLAYIGGDLWLGNAPIKKLPAALTYVGGDVTLGDTEIQEMPAGLTRIRGELDLSNLKSKELRSSLIYIDG